MPLTSVLLVAVGWLSREILGFLFTRVTDRVGRFGYVIKSAGFLCEVETESGQRAVASYRPEYGFLDEPWHDLLCEGTFFNDTRAALFFTKPRVVFLHPDGPRLSCGTPRLFVEGVEEAVLQVPAQGTRNVRLTVRLFREDLEGDLASAIPVLQLEDVGGKSSTYRLANASVSGKELAVWPRRGRLPVFLHRVKGVSSGSQDESEEPPTGS